MALQVPAPDAWEDTSSRSQSDKPDAAPTSTSIKVCGALTIIVHRHLDDPTAWYLTTTGLIVTGRRKLNKKELHKAQEVAWRFVRKQLYILHKQVEFFGCPRRATCCPVQGEPPNIPGGTISVEEHAEVFALYDALHHNHQNAEDIARRGGFGFSECCEFLGHEPVTWRPA